MTQIGKNIKKVRNIRGLSQQSFADLFELTRGNISSYEELRAEPKIDVALRIANYFGIPLTDFIEKDLSVNELLHYNTKLVVETEKLKMTQQLVNVPYIPSLYISDYISHYDEQDFWAKLPNILVPNSSRFRLIAMELEDPELLPVGLTFKAGDVLIYEQVVKENIHRIPGKLAMKTDREGMKFGIYKEKEDGSISISLNAWVEYPFDMDETGTVYWSLRAVYTQIL